MSQKAKQKSSLHTAIIRLARAHYIYILALAVQTIIYDAAKLITRDAVYDRWKIIAILAVINTFVWFWARIKSSSLQVYRLLVLLLVTADIAVASLSVYTQRGMASRAVALYFVPIVISAVLLSRTALFATATLCAAAYATTAFKYFYDHFNEGYKVELYGEVGTYCVLFFIVASLLWVFIRTKRNKS